MKPDPTLAKIRAARHRISERCGHDPRRLVEYYLQVQEAYRDRLIWPSQSATRNESVDSTPTDEQE